MTGLDAQIREMAPSAKAPFLRRIFSEPALSFLREDDGTMVGYEIDRSVNQTVSGYAVIAISKHTILAFVSDLHEEPKLVLFPTAEKIRDTDFGLEELFVTEQFFKKDGTIIHTGKQGKLGLLAATRMPPLKTCDIQAEEFEVSASAALEPAPSAIHTSDDAEVPPDFDDGPPDFEEGAPDFDDGPPDFDEGPNFEEGPPDFDEGPTFEEEPSDIPEPSRSETLKAQSFSKLSDVTDYVVLRMKVPKPLAMELANRVLGLTVPAEQKPGILVQLFCKLFDEHRL